MTQVQLEASKEEKSELLRRLKKVKDVAKETQEKSGAMYVNVRVYPAICSFPRPSLEDMGNSIKSLKEDADSWFGLAREVQSMVPDIKHLRLQNNDTIASEFLPGSPQRARDC